MNSDEVIDAKSINPSKLIEGEIKNGVFDGYARMLTNKGTCQVGYWKAFVPSSKQKSENEHAISIPWGKWCSYLADGTHRLKDDYYIGQQDKASMSQI